jgi:hypothetical protein
VQAVPKVYRLAMPIELRDIYFALHEAAADLLDSRFAIVIKVFEPSKCATKTKYFLRFCASKATFYSAKTAPNNSANRLPILCKSTREQR